MIPRSLLALPLVLVACPDRPLGGTDGDTTTATTTTTTTTSAATTDTSGAPTSTTGPATTGTGAPSTSDADTASTTSHATSTTGGATSTSAGATSTTGGPPSTCGPPCDETWEVFGDLEIFSGGDPPLVYSCLTAVHGDLDLHEDVQQDVLDSLANLRSVDGALTLHGHQQLTDLGFLACLEDTGGLQLSAAPKLADLSALTNLRSAPFVSLRGLAIAALPAFSPEFAGINGLWLTDDPALTDLAAASTWGLAGPMLQLTLERNDALPSLAGLAGLVAAADPDQLYLQLADHPALTSLAGLEAATGFVYLWLSDLPQLASLAPLAGVTEVGELSLDRLPKLTALTGLGALASAGTMTLGACVDPASGGLDALTDLAGLDSLATVGNLGIAGNDALVGLDGAPKLSDVDLLAVTGNPTLTPKAYDAFLAQLSGPPNDDCFGDPPACQCYVILPW